MTRIHLLARSKIPDLVAATALRTLRAPLELPIEAAQREILWILDHEGGSEGSAALVERLLQATTLLVNSASQTLRWGGEPPPALPGPPGCRPLRVEIAERGAGRRTLARLRAAYGFPEIRHLGRSLLWTLHVPETTSDTDCDALLERAVLTTRRSRGLLANPHYQDHRILDHRTRARGEPGGAMRP